ncbi:hypothetical protein B0H15DRAFT_870911 [Mycena belliarum]|uniref:Uncharacterized protein n=1 Tax=Mycena belliarum TaxID=1033014 RepID=A0AAD6XGD1_9AGAR|nr:hypothetical protein B0H15DRAFT_870911 [Mycena belliae]
MPAASFLFSVSLSLSAVKDARTPLGEPLHSLRTLPGAFQTKNHRPRRPVAALSFWACVVVRGLWAVLIRPL